MNILITGGAGFIGSHLVDYHLKKGDKVKVIDNLSTGTLANLNWACGHPGFDSTKNIILSNLEACINLGALVSWADKVYHLASSVGMFHVLADPLSVLNKNVDGIRALLEWLSPSQRFVFASTSEIYDLKIEREFNHIRWNYALSKLVGEALGFSYVGNYGLGVTNIRLFNTVGPRQSGHYGMVVPRFIEQALSNKPITVYGDGSQARCFCDVALIVEALDKLTSMKVTDGETLNLGSNSPMSIMNLAVVIKEKTGSKSNIVTMRYEDAYPEGYEDVDERIPDLKQTLRYLPDFRVDGNFDETLDRMIEEKIK